MNSPFSLYYFKSRKIDLGEWEIPEQLDSVLYNPYDIAQLQSYNPIYSLFFELTETNFNKISLNHVKHITDLNNVWNTQSKKEEENASFIKFSPLFDPIHTLIGKYDNEKITNLGEMFHESILAPKKTSKNMQKILNPFNASYVDCFFNYLSSQLKNNHAFENGIDFYGSYVGIQKHYKMNITDDYEYLQDSEYFLENENKTYILNKKSDSSVPLPNMNSHKNKPKIFISEPIELSVKFDELDIDGECEPDIDGECEPDIDGECEPDIDGECEPDIDGVCEPDIDGECESDGSESDGEMDLSLVYEKESSHNSSVSSSDNSNINESSDDDWSEMTHEKMECEDETIYAYMKDFPIQLICIEQCDGTFDELLEKNMISDEETSSALMQVIMTLITYQKAFQFTHNDLHTNNIMYKNTDKVWIEYTYCDKKYRVPTYGKIFKIIDFGRSIYRFQNKIICSDSFAPGGDANTQYNAEPFYNNKKPRLEPNMSFDLCRLGCSMYDFIIDDSKTEKWSELQDTIMRWCTDDLNKNILYKKNGEERYPNFKLYKMIARIVHKHTPESQLEFPFFSRYLDLQIDSDKFLEINIDHIPKY